MQHARPANRDSGSHATRVLIVLPSWVGDAVMATPALGLLRAAMPGAFLGGLARPGIDQLLAGTDFLDEFHRAPPSGIMAPKVSAQRVRTRRYDAAILLTNSFSSALSVRLAGIRERVGYDRDGRAMLLTRRLSAPKRRDTPPYAASRTAPDAWAPVPACEYYLALAREFLSASMGVSPASMPPAPPMRLALTPDEAAAGEALLARIGLAPGERFVVLNPGGNNPAKRWPAERFWRLAQEFGAGAIAGAPVRALVSGSPGESELVAGIVAAGDAAHGPVDLVRLGVTLGSLKALLLRASLLVTNDTGPRHIGAAFGTPVVSLFGPTDHRWTTIAAHCPPRRDGAQAALETILLADPTLPESEVANDHPERCAIDRITYESVAAACAAALAG